jgi:CIC family chloride channel protein
VSDSQATHEPNRSAARLNIVSSAARAHAEVGEAARARASWWRIASESNVWSVVAAILIGALTALANVAFRWAIESAHRLFWVDLGGFLALSQLEKYDIFAHGLSALPDNWGYIPLIPMAAMALIAILERYFPGEMEGYGLPRFLELVNIKGGYLRRRWITLKTISAAITVGSGMSAGIEGPIAQIGGSIGSTVGRALRPSFERLRVLIACGSAAAIAASFRTPIAGVMFAQEIVLVGEVETHSFYLVVLAAGVSSVVSHYLRADYPILLAPEFEFPLGHELMFLVLLGAMIGLLAVAFIRVFYSVRDAFDRASIPQTILPVVGGAIVGVTLIFFPQIGGNGYETMNAALRGQLGIELLWALVLVKMVMTSVTLGCGGAGGVFAPSMFVGATFGG